MASRTGRVKGVPGCVASVASGSRAELEGPEENARRERTVKEDVYHYMSAVRPAIQYLGPVLCLKVEAAMELACEAQHRQKGRSGEPHISHLVAVTLILASLGMDCDTIVAAILHDTVEHAFVTFDEIELHFGSSVRRIVEGETKVSKLPKMAQNMSGSKADEQAENLRWMFVAMIEDWRIIVVKVADRLHTMRTLEFVEEEKQTIIARETLEIFAPLAHRLGLWNIKSELENLAFRFLYPSEYRQVEEMVRVRLPTYRKVLDESRALLEEVLSRDEILRRNVRVEVTARTKELYSLWTKMNHGNKSIHQIFDLAALRVNLHPKVSNSHEVFSRQSDAPQISESEAQRAANLEESLCYHVLGIVHNMWHPYPQRVKDYIAFPKENGYRSLHTTVMAGSTPTPVEVQIRTSEMHKVAEYGKAAHCVKNVEDTAWLSKIRECEDEISSSREFVEVVRREILGRRVFVFVVDATDIGATRILNLPKGSTAVDAAVYADQSLLESMIAFKVNGTLSPLSQELQNGDVVSFVKSKYSPGPQKEWLDHAKMRRTKTQLKLYFRRQKQKARSAKGWEIVREYLKVHVHQDLREPTDIPVAAFQEFGVYSVDNFCMLIASSSGSEQSQLLSRLADYFRQQEKTPSTKYPREEETVIDRASKVAQIILDKDSKTAQLVEISSCCLPLPGDEIFAYNSDSSRVSRIHRVCCSEGASSQEMRDASITGPLIWEIRKDTDSTMYKTWIEVTCQDRNGLLSDVTAAISSAPIKGTQSVTTGRTATLEYCLHVRNLDMLRAVIDSVSQVPGVLSIKRRGSHAVGTGESFDTSKKVAGLN